MVRPASSSARSPRRVKTRGRYREAFMEVSAIRRSPRRAGTGNRGFTSSSRARPTIGAMPLQDLPTLRCPCGLRLAVPAEGTPGSHVEAGCECGRRLDLQRAERSWVPVGEIFAEGSVPVEGFSRGLRLERDAQRFWFPLVGGGGRRVNVHLVFSHC